MIREFQEWQTVYIGINSFHEHYGRTTRIKSKTKFYFTLPLYTFLKTKQTNSRIKPLDFENWKMASELGEDFLIIFL